ncbi:MAG TPA: hypothetical protein VIZ43_18315 [Trebonia sp.]
MAERKSILLRLDPTVHDALAKWAADEMRSTNAQIEFLLRRALGDAGRMPGGARQMRRPGRPAATANSDGDGGDSADGADSDSADADADADADGTDQ